MGTGPEPVADPAGVPTDAAGVPCDPGPEPPTPDWDPLAPLLAWVGVAQQLGTVALGSMEQVSGLSRAQWSLMRQGLDLMSDMPLTALERSGRELARLRAAVAAVQGQMDLFDEQLAAMEQVVRPLHEWADAWRTLAERPPPS